MAKLKDTTIVGGGSDKTLQIVNPQLQEVITIDSDGMITKPESSNIGIGLKNSAQFHVVAASDNLYTSMSNMWPTSTGTGRNLCTITTSNALVKNTKIIFRIKQFATRTIYSGSAYLSSSTSGATGIEIGSFSQSVSDGTKSYTFEYTVTQADIDNNRKYINIYCNKYDSASDGEITISYSRPSSSASNSVAIGNNAAARVSKTVSIGYNAGTSAPTNTASTNINCTGGTSHKIAIGIGAAPILYYSGGASTIATTSDRRDKTDFIDIRNASLFLNKLHPVTYVSNDRYEYCTENDITTFDKISHEKGEKKGTRRIPGLIAQEVYETLKSVYNDDNYAAIVDFNNYDNDLSENQFEKYFMRYDAIIPFLIKGFQEQQEYIKHLESRIDELSKK